MRVAIFNRHRQPSSNKTRQGLELSWVGGDLEGLGWGQPHCGEALWDLGQLLDKLVNVLRACAASPGWDSVRPPLPFLWEHPPLFISLSLFFLFTSSWSPQAGLCLGKCVSLLGLPERNITHWAA